MLLRMLRGCQAPESKKKMWRFVQADFFIATHPPTESCQTEAPYYLHQAYSLGTVREELSSSSFFHINYLNWVASYSYGMHPSPPGNPESRGQAHKRSTLRSSLATLNSQMVSRFKGALLIRKINQNAMKPISDPTICINISKVHQVYDRSTIWRFLPQNIC